MSLKPTVSCDVYRNKITVTPWEQAAVAAAAQFSMMKSFSVNKLKLSNKSATSQHLTGTAFEFMSHLTAFD